MIDSWNEISKGCHHLSLILGFLSILGGFLLSALIYLLQLSLLLFVFWLTRHASRTAKLVYIFRKEREWSSYYIFNRHVDCLLDLAQG